MGEIECNRWSSGKRQVLAKTGKKVACNVSIIVWQKFGK